MSTQVCQAAGRALQSLLVGMLIWGATLAHAGSYDDFFIAIKRDDPATINELLIRGFDPNTVNPRGEPGLLLAVREPSLNVLPVLIAWPKTNVEIRSRTDESALMLAALKGLTDICRQLIARGADVNKPGWAPLHYAATHGHLDIIRLLLDQYAYIDAESPNGSTPLMMAAHYGTTEAVQLLLEAGADPLLKNAQGLTAIDFAHGAGRKDTANLIAATIRAKQPKGW